MELSLEQRMAHLLETVPCLESSGIQLAYIKNETVCLKMPMTKSTTNLYGRMFGGATYGLADVTAGMTAALDGCDYITLNSSFNFADNIASGMVWSVGSVLYRKKRSAAIDVKVYSDESVLLALGVFNVLAVIE